jgi:hypothetical protein
VGICGNIVESNNAGRGKKGLMCGAHMSVTKEEKRRNGGIRKPERKARFGECSKAFRGGWAKWGGDGQ